MNLQQAELYQCIQEFSLDEKNACFPFSRKLAKENNWTPEYTQRAIEEYKKFAFLAAVTGNPVSPSDTIDQVWHLHLTYTESYWQEFCQILGMELHHFPSSGSNQETDKFNGWYSNTIASYQQFFGENPPSDIWTKPHIRFDIKSNFQRVDINNNWVIPKPNFKLPHINIPTLIPQKFYLGLLFTLALIIANSQVVLASNNSNSQTSSNSATSIFLFFFFLGVIIILASRGGGGSSCGGGGGGGGGGCGGGGGGCGGGGGGCGGGG